MAKRLVAVPLDDHVGECDDKISGVVSWDAFEEVNDAVYWGVDTSWLMALAEDLRFLPFWSAK